MRERVLVTGAAGFIGSNLVARLVRDGYWVRATDIKPTPERADLYKQADDLCLGRDLRDLSDALDLAAGIDWVFHLAADHGGAGYFYSDADFKAANNNLRIDQNVLRLAMRGDVERLFFASSACTYPVWAQGHGARPMKESDLGRGEGEQLYGMAKRMSTLLMEGSDFDARSGIFHTIYGPGQDYREPRAKFPTALCRKLLEDPKRVVLWGDGTQVRTFLYIDDALDRIQTVMRRPYEGPVNIGSDEEVTVLQCAEWAAAAAGADPEWVHDLAQPTGVEHRASDNREYERRYGPIETPMMARDGFARLYNWMRDNAKIKVKA